MTFRLFKTATGLERAFLNIQEIWEQIWRENSEICSFLSQKSFTKFEADSCSLCRIDWELHSRLVRHFFVFHYKEREMMPSLMTLRYVGHCPTPCKGWKPLTWPKGYQPFGNQVLLFGLKPDFSVIYCKLSYKLSAPDIFQRSEAHHHNTVLCRFAHLYTMMTVPLFQPLKDA